MSDKLTLIRLPIVLLIIAFLGKLIGGMAGMPYEVGAQVFGMVPLAIHLCIIWGALGRSLYGQSLGSAAMLGLLIAVVGQVLILGATFFSYVAGMETHFNEPMAIARVTREIGFGEAMGARAVGLVINGILGAVAASIGYALGGFVATRRVSA